MHGNDLGKRSLFLSVPAITYPKEKKNPFVFLRAPFSLGHPPRGSIHHSVLVLASLQLLLLGTVLGVVFG